MCIFRTFLLCALITLLSCYPPHTLAVAAPEQISIQLKWQHSYQFAGYYAAIEKGFYRDAELDVALKEIDFPKILLSRLSRVNLNMGCLTVVC